jgi:uncharacterized LabA/DUF88 family protein
MIKNKEQRVGIFVDVSNLYYSARHYGARVNFETLLKTATAGRKLVRAIAYVVKANNPDEESFFGALDKMGFEVREKDLQIFAGGRKKADWDVGIAMDMIKMSGHLDVLVLVSGDGDYIPLVDYLQNHGNLVEVIAFGDGTSNKLVEQADDFFDLGQAKSKFLIRSGGGRGKSRKKSRSGNRRTPVINESTSNGHVTPPPIPKPPELD